MVHKLVNTTQKKQKKKKKKKITSALAAMKLDEVNQYGREAWGSDSESHLRLDLRSQKSQPSPSSTFIPFL
jgi:hypothetical protein